MKTLVTGGAGYIGSHMVRRLCDAGHDVVVVDDLSNGHREAVAKEATFVEASVANVPAMTALLRDEAIEAVFHFAGRIRVEESVSSPRLYHQSNTVASLALLEAVLDVGVRSFVFSSTAAVYGMPDETPIDESHPLRPVNPYGETKLATERALEAYGRAYGLRWMALRYFNAAGARPEAGLGERHEPETHLVPIVLEVASGERKELAIYGNDFPTTDGSCVRDYIHVRDLCDAHLAALDHLARGGESGAVNLGTGSGHSVREVVEVARKVTGAPIPTRDAPRRAGDPPALVAKVDRALRLLGWTPACSDLERIVADAWAWKTR